MANGGSVSVVAGAVVDGSVQVGRSGVRGKSVVVRGSNASVLVTARHHAAEEARLALVLLVDVAISAVAGGVVVGGRGSVALLLAVVTSQGKLGEERQDEEEDGNDSHCKASSLETASRAVLGKGSEAARALAGGSIGLTTAEGSIEIAIAGACTVTVGYSDVNEGANEGEVDSHSEEGSDCASGQTPEQQHGAQSVENGSARDTLNGANGIRDAQVMVVKSSEEVGVDAEDEGGAEELDGTERPLKELETKSDLFTHDGGIKCRKLAGLFWGCDRERVGGENPKKRSM